MMMVAKHFTVNYPPSAHQICVRAINKNVENIEDKFRFNKSK